VATPIPFFPLIKDKNSLSSHIFQDKHSTHDDEVGGRSPRLRTLRQALQSQGFWEEKDCLTIR